MDPVALNDKGVNCELSLPNQRFGKYEPYIRIIDASKMSVAFLTECLSES